MPAYALIMIKVLKELCLWHDVGRKPMICALAKLRSWQSNRHDMFVAYFGFELIRPRRWRWDINMLAPFVPNVIVLHWLYYRRFADCGSILGWKFLGSAHSDYDRVRQSVNCDFPLRAICHNVFSELGRPMACLFVLFVAVFRGYFMWLLGDAGDTSDMTMLVTVLLQEHQSQRSFGMVWYYVAHLQARMFIRNLLAQLLRLGLSPSFRKC